MGEFFSDFKYIDNAIKYYLKGNDEDVSINDKSLLRKPVSLNTKSYRFMEAMLRRNIGSHNFRYDGFGTTIGMNANPFLNSETDPWFFIDEAKNKYENYLSYVNDLYFHGTMLPPNFQTVYNTKGESLSQITDYNEMLEEISRVGAIHHYNIDDIAGARMFLPNGTTNPNGYDDTRLGVINNFYLSGTLRNSYNKTLVQKTSSYHQPSYGSKESTSDESFSVTQGAYHKFGLKGEYGIINSSFGAKEGVVTSQQLLTDDIIPWSTADNYFASNNNNERMGNILGVGGDIYAENYSDNERNENGYKSYPFGNFYSLSYSLGLLTASGGKTQEFIAKSIYGVDLLSTYIPSLEYNKGDITSLKKMSRKKYFASIGSRGTNYIDAMTGIDVEYEMNHKNDIIRIKLNDAGNDNLYTFNTYLVYLEAEGNKQPVEINNILGNNGTSIGYYQSYNDNILNKEDIISYTNRQFQANKFKTLIGRFHTDAYKNVNDVKVLKDFTSSAVSQYGMSRGRNLLKVQKSDVNGFEDPYCRVWTYHKQYSRYNNLIRPFHNVDQYAFDVLMNDWQKNRDRLLTYGTRNKETGMVQITQSNSLTKCMFSIENLAWDEFLLNERNYQKGPNGGRIMWFPPYGLTFQEQSKANWSATQFIGRGEKIYSYVDTERSGSLSFQLLIDHPSIINSIPHDTENLESEVDNVDSVEQRILRFFAGCDVLWGDVQVVEKRSEEEKANVPILRNGTIQNYYIEFNIYFPYGYSGDEGDVEWYDYLINGTGIIIPHQDMGAVNVFTTSGLTQQIGGYEMENDLGLSCITNWATFPPSQETTSGLKHNLTKIYYQLKDSDTLYDIPLYTLDINKTSQKEKNPLKNWVTNYWGFLIDKSYGEVVFNSEKNYLDVNSYHLNSKKSKKKKKDIEENKLDISFGDLAIFLQVKTSEEREKTITSQATQTLLKKIFEEYKVKEVNLTANSIIDKALGQKRNENIKEWLKKSNYFSSCEIKSVANCDEQVNEKLKKDINSKTSKEARKVNVVISLEKEILDLEMDYYDRMNDTIIQKAKNNTNYDVKTNPMVEMALLNLNEYQKKLSVSNNNEEGNGWTNRVVAEENFFKDLTKNDNFLRSKIQDKIKYFDPAFHSMTPEGFNERLTFLQQCTRQGTTKSALYGGKNTRNLAFGKPPICVLRIGDFFNTKIVIDSVNIRYDETQWDLNDEGIGIMPMFAQVDISFNFIGGSELANAVSILQNAVTYNYYANTSVYNPFAKHGEIK